MQLHLSVEDLEGAAMSKRHVCTVANLAEAEQRFRDAGVEIFPTISPRLVGRVFTFAIPVVIVWRSHKQFSHGLHGFTRNKVRKSNVG